MIIIEAGKTKIELEEENVKFYLKRDGGIYNEDSYSEPYSIPELINNAEKYREKADLEAQINWEKYQKILKDKQLLIDKLEQENILLTKKLKDEILK